MVALKTERRVFLWRMRFLPSPAEAVGQVTVNLEDVIGLLEAEWTGNRARVFLSESNRVLDDGDPAADEKNQLYIAEIKRDPKAEAVTILVNRGDPNAVSPSFID